MQFIITKQSYTLVKHSLLITALLIAMSFRDGVHLGALLPMNGNFSAEDDFSSNSYSGGTGDWIGNWTETGDDDTDTGNDPNNGYIQVSSGSLRFDVPRNGDATVSLDRSVDVSSASAITVDFEWVKGGDRRPANTLSLDVQYSIDGGATFISGLFLDKEVLYGRGERTSFSIPNLAGVNTLILRFEYDFDDSNRHIVLVNDVTLTDTPELIAYAIQASCDNGVAQNNAYLQLSSATNADRVGFSLGNTYTGPAYSGATDISAANFPVIIEDNLSNPSTTQAYTIRVFNGSDGCFTDQVVTLFNQDCQFGCECNEFLYLNDRLANETLKFRINSDGSLSMIGSPWLDNIAQPHGLGVDLDGNIYIAETPFSSYGDLFKIKPDGTVLDRKFYRTDKFPFQIFSNRANKLFFNRDLNPEVLAIDICNIADGDPMTDPIIGQSDPGLNNAGSIIRPWGAYLNQMTGDYWITDANSVCKSAGGSPIYKGTTHDLVGAMGGNIFTPFPVDEHCRDRTGDGVPDLFRPNGIFEDQNGNIYVVYGQTAVAPGNQSYVAKYDAMGNLIAQSAIDMDDTDGGWFDSRGLVVSESGLIYLSSEDGLVANGETCISVFEDDGNGNLVELPAFRINAEAGRDTEAKTIYIAKACCPTSNRAVFDEQICYDGSVDQQFFLGQILAECNGGAIGEGTWTQITNDPNFDYDACDNSISVNGPGQVQFTLSSDGTGPFSECGAFEIVVNITATQVPTIVDLRPDCDQNSAAIALDATSNSGSGTLSYEWRGPNGFTSTDEDPTIPEGEDGVGRYTVVVTDSEGCSTTESIELDRSNCARLPVELINFDAKATACHTQLFWSTASETNSSHFEVQHSQDAKNFSTIGKVQSAGTTLERQNYTFEHEVSKSGIAYYGLKQIDVDGTFEYSATVSVSVNCEVGKELSVFPSPIGEGQQLTVQFFVEGQADHLTIMDNTGKIVLRINQQSAVTGWNQMQIDISNLNNGVYFITDGRGEYKRFIVTK